MAILAECPGCHRKQAVKNRVCDCGWDLVKAKRESKVRYWINYRLPNGKQRREYAGFSINDARAADGKRKAQKIENPGILERVPAEKMTFNELAAWFLELRLVKELKSYKRVGQALSNFNQVFGDKIVSTIKPLDLENYQHKRIEEGRAFATVDMEICIAKTMITKAFDNDRVDGRTVKAFRRVKRKLRWADNARKRTLTIKEYLLFLDAAPKHLKQVMIFAMNTGMRAGEIRGLRWGHIDREKWVVRLPAELTKENRAKTIPLNHNVRAVLADLPRTIHHDFVFAYKNEPIKAVGNWRKSFSTACKSVGIPHGQTAPDGIIFHDIRRTVKTNMVNAGVDQVHRDVILGHSLKGMDVHYIHLSEDDLHQAMGKYTAWLDRQMANVDQTVDQVHKKG